MSTETSPREHPRAAAIEGTSLTTWVHRIDEADGRNLDHTATWTAVLTDVAVAIAEKEHP